jgi:hypothetical protein
MVSPPERVNRHNVTVAGVLSWAPHDAVANFDS